MDPSPPRSSSCCTVCWLAANRCPMTNRLSLLKECFWSRLSGVCVASVWSLKKLESPRTKSHNFWTLWEVSQALHRVPLYSNSNKPMSLTKETYVAMHFKDVSPTFRDLWSLGVGRGTTKSCLCVHCSRNVCYLRQSCSLGPQFLPEPFSWQCHAVFGARGSCLHCIEGRHLHHCTYWDHYKS